MSQWYVYHDGEVLGPFPLEELEGRLEPGTRVCPVGDETWVEAGEVNELEPTLKPEYRSGSPEPTGASGEPDGGAIQGSSAQPEGSEPPEPAGEEPEGVDRRTDGDGSEEVEVGDIEPTLDTLYTITQEASDEDLVREYNRYWHRYDGSEQKIIMKEFRRRELDPETGEPLPD